MARDEGRTPRGQVVIGEELALTDEITMQLEEIRKENALILRENAQMRSEIAQSSSAKRVFFYGVATGLVVWAIVELSPRLIVTFAEAAFTVGS